MRLRLVPKSRLPSSSRTRVSSSSQGGPLAPDGGAVQEVTPRLRFLELFAGTARLTHSMIDLGGDRVVCETPEDVYDGWDILNDEHFQRILEVAKKADWVHGAQSCSTFSRGGKGTFVPIEVLELARRARPPEGR